MQHSNKKTIQLAVTLGQTVKELRESTDGLTLNRLANEYELYKGTLSEDSTIVNLLQFGNFQKH